MSGTLASPLLALPTQLEIHGTAGIAHNPEWNLLGTTGTPYLHDVGSVAFALGNT